MKAIEHKSRAVRIVGDNKGECIQAILLIGIPKLVYIVEIVVIAVLFIAKLVSSSLMVLLFVGVTVLFLTLNSLVSSVGEMMLIGISRNEPAFVSSVNLLKKIGAWKIVKVKLVVLWDLFCTMSFTLLPAVLLGAAFVYFLESGVLSVYSFVVLIVGLVLISIAAISQLLKECDKYDLVYQILYDSPNMLPRDIVTTSVRLASRDIKEIRRCKNSFLGFTVLSLLLFPLIIPIMYTSLHKKLAVNDIYNVICNGDCGQKQDKVITDLDNTLQFEFLSVNY